MIEYTPDQILFVESFTNKRDSLTLEVGLLTHEKEVLQADNKNISELNAALQKGIDEMNENASKLGFEQSEKVATLKLEVLSLEEEIKTLREKRDLLSKDLDEKNNTLISLGVLIKSIQLVTEDTTNQIRKMSNDLGIYTGKVESASSTISGDADRVKLYADELSTVIDKERQINRERTKEIDAREIAVIGREKMVELKYAEVVKNLNK